MTATELHPDLMSDSDQSVDIAYASHCKKDAETKIQEVIQQFEQQTNLRVDGIDYDRPFTFADRSVSTPIFVTIRAMLP
jgi:hypothetical protein